MKLVIQTEQKTYTYLKKSEIDAIQTQLDGRYWIKLPTCVERGAGKYTSHNPKRGKITEYWIDREHTIAIPAHSIIDIDYIHDKFREIKD